MLFSLLLMPFIGKAEQQQTKQISTPDGTVSVNSQTVTPVPQQVTPVAASKLRQLNELDKAAASFLATYLPDADQSLKAYDEAFHAWQKDKTHRYSEEDVIERLGAYLGNKLVADFDMEWVEVSDEYGTDLAVRARKYEVISYPFSSVAKRVQNNQYDFMVGVYYAVQDVIISDPKKR